MSLFVVDGGTLTIMYSMFIGFSFHRVNTSMFGIRKKNYNCLMVVVKE
jgi:ABC-type multidrug transport system permease subunit